MCVCVRLYVFCLFLGFLGVPLCRLTLSSHSYPPPVHRNGSLAFCLLVCTVDGEAEVCIARLIEVAATTVDVIAPFARSRVLFAAAAFLPDENAEKQLS